MTVQEVLLKALDGELHWFQAADIPGMSPRTRRRWRERYDQHADAPTHEHIFPPRVFTQLQNAHAVVLPYDGGEPAATAILLSEAELPGCADQLFDHLERGAL